MHFHYRVYNSGIPSKLCPILYILHSSGFLFKTIPYSQYNALSWDTSKTKAYLLYLLAILLTILLTILPASQNVPYSLYSTLFWDTSGTIYDEVHYSGIYS